MEVSNKTPTSRNEETAIGGNMGKMEVILLI